MKKCICTYIYVNKQDKRNATHRYSPQLSLEAWSLALKVVSISVLTMNDDRKCGRFESRRIVV